MQSWELSVGGHEWLVSERDSEPGVYDFVWLTRADQYGFTVGSSNGSAISEDFARREIADILNHIDPETGYLG